MSEVWKVFLGNILTIFIIFIYERPHFVSPSEQILQLREIILIFPISYLLSEELPWLIVCEDEGEQHDVDHQGDRDVGHVGVLALVLHETCMNPRCTNQAKTVDKVQPFKTYCVLDLWFPLLFSPHPEEDLDDQDCDDHEDRVDDLDSNAEEEKILVPVVDCGVGEESLVFRQERLWK